MPVNFRSPAMVNWPTERCTGKVVPSLRRPTTSRPLPMILARPVRQVAREILVVLLVIRRRHQHVDVLANDVVFGIAKQPLGRRIERLHAAVLIDDDDAVYG